MKSEAFFVAQILMPIVLSSCALQVLITWLRGKCCQSDFVLNEPAVFPWLHFLCFHSPSLSNIFWILPRIYVVLICLSLRKLKIERLSDISTCRFSAFTVVLPLGSFHLGFFKGQHFEKWDHELFILPPWRTSPGMIIHSFIQCFQQLLSTF